MDPALAPSSDQISSPAHARFDRRVVLKAAAFLGLLATGQGRAAALGGDPDLEGATSETRGQNWFENDQLDAVGGASDGEPLTIATAFPITAVGAHWDSSGPDDAKVEIWLSMSGADFDGPWVLHVSHDTGDQDEANRHFTGLVCTEGSQFIRYRTVDGIGNPITLPDFALTYIDASNGPSMPALGGVESASLDGSRPPRVIPRWEWGANESYRFDDSGEWWFPAYRTVEHAIVHHSETSNVENPYQAIRSIQYYHAVTRGWHDIGYNYLVDRFGNVYEGRIGGRNVVGGHALEYAWGSSGICFMGNHSFADVSTAAQAGMVAIVAWATRFLDPLGRSYFKDIPNLPTICGHRDVISTSCPGDLAYDDLPQIRRLVSDTLAWTGSWPSVTLIIGDYVRTSSSVNLRSSQSTGASVVYTLGSGVTGTVYDGPVLAEGYSWYQIATDYGTGWAVDAFLDRSPPVNGWKEGRFYRDAVVENIDSVTLRSLPSTSASAIRSLPARTAMSILGGPEDANFNRWYKVRTPYGNGWVAARFLTWSNQSPPTTDPDPPTTGRFAIGDDVAVIDGPLNLRSSSSTSGTIVAQLRTGATGEVLAGPESGSGYIWYRLATGSGNGWVVQDYLGEATDPPRFSTGDRVSVSDGPLNVRSSAGTTNSIVTQVATGATGPVLAGPSSASGYTWFRVQFAAGTGWVVQDYLERESVTPSSGGFNFNDDTIVADGPLNMRSAPSASATVVTKLQTGDRCVIKDGPSNQGGYSWYQVSSNGRLGWVAGDFLAHGIRVGGFCTIFTGNGSLRLRSGAGTSFGVVTTVADGTSGSVLAGPTDNDGFTWWRVSTSRGTGWAAGAYLIPG